MGFAMFYRNAIRPRIARVSPNLFKSIYVSIKEMKNRMDFSQPCLLNIFVRKLLVKKIYEIINLSKLSTAINIFYLGADLEDINFPFMCKQVALLKHFL